MVITVEKGKFYYPNKIARDKMFPTPGGSTNFYTLRDYVRDAIDNDELKAINYSKGDKQGRYKIRGRALAGWLKSLGYEVELV